MVSGGSDGSVRVWSLISYTPIHRLAAHDNSVTSLQFDDSRIVSGGSDGRVKVWDLARGNLVRELGQPAEAVWRVVFEEEKAVVLASRAGKTVMEVWSFAPPSETDDSLSSSVSASSLRGDFLHRYGSPVSLPEARGIEAAAAVVRTQDLLSDARMNDGHDVDSFPRGRIMSRGNPSLLPIGGDVTMYDAEQDTPLFDSRNSSRILLAGGQVDSPRIGMDESNGNDDINDMRISSPPNLHGLGLS